MLDVVELTQRLVQAGGLSGDERCSADVAESAMRELGFREVLRDSYGSVIGLIGPAETDIAALFDGHTDVVPATGNWSVDPHGGLVRDGRIFGRGSTDMKGGLAAAICGVAKAAATAPLDKQLAVSASVMEEIIEGVALAKILDDHKPDCVVICEPSSLELRIAQRGRMEICLTIHGKSAHAAFPDGSINPIEGSARALAALNDLRFKTDPLLGRGVLVPVSIVSDPFPSPSMVPVSVTINFDRRTVPGDTRESVLEEIRDCLAGCNNLDYSLTLQADKATTYTGVELQPERNFPPWKIAEDHPVSLACIDALETAGISVRIGAWAACTNGSESAGRRNIPTIGLGPGDMTDAHTVDESVEISQLERAVEVYSALALNLTKPKGP